MLVNKKIVIDVEDYMSLMRSDMNRIQFLDMKISKIRHTRESAYKEAQKWIKKDYDEYQRIHGNPSYLEERDRAKYIPQLDDIVVTFIKYYINNVGDLIRDTSETSKSYLNEVNSFADKVEVIVDRWKLPIASDYKVRMKKAALNKPVETVESVAAFVSQFEFLDEQGNRDKDVHSVLDEILQKLSMIGK